MNPLMRNPSQPRDLPHRQPRPMRRPDRLIPLPAQPVPIRINPTELIR